MKLMKVFDCQSMPKEIRKIFFNCTEAANDSYVGWHMGDMFQDDAAKVDQWLIQEGALQDEIVIIKHWW